MAEDYSKYTGKRVIVTRNLAEPNEKGEQAVEIEGVCQVGNELGILIKPKGKTNVALIEADDIELVQFAPDKEKKLTRKRLKPVEYGAARNHLLERHGLTLEKVNDLSEQEALEFHEELDHNALDLGHYHGLKEDEEQEQDAPEPVGASA